MEMPHLENRMKKKLIKRWVAVSFSFFSSEKGTLSLLGVLISPRPFLPAKQLCVSYCLSFLLLSQITTPSMVLRTQIYDPVVTRLTRVSLGRDLGVLGECPFHWLFLLLQTGCVPCLTIPFQLQSQQRPLNLCQAVSLWPFQGCLWGLAALLDNPE